MDLQRKAIAEVLGTLWLVLGGCGSAVLAGIFFVEDASTGIGFLGVALAFGLTVLTGAYALGLTGVGAPAGFGPLAIGMALTLIHLVSIPVTNTSVNPARSTGPALFVGDWAIEQLWLFWLAPLVGGGLAGLVHRYVIEERPQTRTGHG
jgi:aquaporin Z